MNKVNAVAQAEFSPEWRDLDDRYNDPEVPLEGIFDAMVERQGGDLEEPCAAAQELLDQWRLDDDKDYLPDWRAAVDRLTPGRAEAAPAEGQPAEGEDAANDNGDASEADASEADAPTARVSGDVGEPEFLNQAELIGEEPEGFADFLNRDATLMIGEMWGARDRRNTPDEKWTNTSMPWLQWIVGFDKTANSHAWGFSRHAEAKDKAGGCMVLGSSVGGARKAKAMDTMFAMGLDVDSGATLDSVIDKIEELGLLCFVHTSYNHRKQGIALKRDEVLRKLGITREPTMDDIRQYLHEHDKNRYEQAFIAGISIKKQKHLTPDGVKILLDTPPLEKFRLIFPLAEPVKIIDLAQTHQEALDLWEAKITGLARNMLGVHFDVACTDPSRLFYLARHPKGSDFRSAILKGTPLRFEDVKPMKKTAYTSNRDGDAFAMAGGAMDGDRPPLCMTPKGRSLNDWHNQYKDRFLLANLLEDMCSDKIRHAGNEATGHVHVECPFEHEHSSDGGTATMAVNCIDSQTGYWTIFCRHDACQGRHKLQFVEEMLRAGWFDEELLFDMDEGYLLEAADEEEDPRATVEALLSRAAALDDPTDAEIKALLTQAHAQIGVIGETGKRKVLDAIVVNAGLGKREVDRLWKEVAGKKRAADKAQERETSAPIVNEWHFMEMCEYGERRIHDTNRADPRVFHSGHDLGAIRESSRGDHGFRVFNREAFANHLNTVARFFLARVDGDKRTLRGVSAPQDVVNHLFAADRQEYPALRGLVTTPIFTQDGSLLTEPGYDWSSQLYYQPDPRMSIPEVSTTPTKDEVFEAKRLLTQEILADFMLDGMDRAEVIRKVLCCEEVNGELCPLPGAEPESTPSLAHAVVMALFPFVRDMIAGNAPGIAIDKQKPGAGAGKLEATMSMIFAGSGTPALALPATGEEMTKVLLAALRTGRPNLFFDNINHSVDSGELASAMTAPVYEARILGSSETAQIEVRSQWVIAGNKLQLSDELIRRFCLIYLDPRTATPESRTGFRHPEIEDWVRENRGRLVWACLTLVRNYLASGKPSGVRDKGSYSQWARVMGGILEAAGIRGFLENEAAMKARSSSSEDPLHLFLARVAEYEDGTPFVTGTVAKRHPERTVSIQKMLEEFNADEMGEARSLRVPGFGYDSRDGTYQTQKLGAAFKRVAAEMHRIGDCELWFEPEANSSGTNIWRLRKKVV